MNMFELIIFLVVTGSVGAAIGWLVGVFTGNSAHAARLGTLLGPIVAAIALTIWAFGLQLRKKREKPEERTNH